MKQAWSVKTFCDRSKCIFRKLSCFSSVTRLRSPPVGEAASPTFFIKQRAHLDSIVRQAEGNPILSAAAVIRSSQGQKADWTWLKPMKTAEGLGIFFPGDAMSQWMKKAFTSEGFDQNPDTFRYLAYTNRRVKEINTTIRRWRYGENIPTPFMKDERAMFRAPLMFDKNILFGTNEEATVLSIKPDNFSFDVPADSTFGSWTAALPSWKIELRKDSGETHEVHMPVDEDDYKRVTDRLRQEALESYLRWDVFHEFTSSMAHLQSIYSMTVHVSQGSTFGTVFVDVPDIRRRERDNLLEMQQLLYTAITRPTHRVIVAGT